MTDSQQDGPVSDMQDKSQQVSTEQRAGLAAEGRKVPSQKPLAQAERDAARLEKVVTSFMDRHPVIMAYLAR